MDNTLLLVLDGPLQAWGERARWSVRDTNLEPTHSGVAGLLACACGISSGPDLDTLAGRFAMGVRCDRPGVLLRDYHTVVGGVLSAAGKVKLNASTKQPETVVSERYYMADACYLVALQAAPPDIARWALALQNPVWPPYLGRKACVPSRPIFEGTGDFGSLTEALSAWSRIDGEGRGQNAPESARAVIEAAAGVGLRRRDAVVDSQARVFGVRYVKEYMIKLPQEV